jgi:Domain of unknown function (DUF4394)
MKISRLLTISAAAFAALGAVILAAPAVSSAVSVPAVCSESAEGGTGLAYGLTADQRLICFKANRPSANRTLMSVALLSLPDTALVGIDVRPANGLLYGVGDGGGIYLLDPLAGRPELKARLNVGLSGRSFGLDFNPTVDRLRVVSDVGQNLRVNVDTGGATVDGALNLTAGVTAMGVGGVAYTNNDNDASTATTLFDIDSLADQLVTQNPPNNGTLVAVGKLGYDTSSAVAFDIRSTIKDGKAVANEGFVALGGGGSFYRIDLATGELSFVGNLGNDSLLGFSFPIA